MRVSTRFMVRGIFHEMRGKVKEMVGSVCSNRKLGAKGTFERITGKMQRKVGKVQGMCGL